MDQSEHDGGAQVAAPSKGGAKPTKALPTQRLSFEKQLSILRAYGAASGTERKAVTIAEVGSILSDIATTSVSLCNQFFVDVGLLAREGNRFRPAASVIEYLHAHEWNPETAANKLGAELRDTWFARCLQPKLAYRTLTRDEAVSYLAEEAKATTDYRKQLDVLIDYLDAAALVKADGTSVTKASNSEKEPGAPSEEKPSQQHKKKEHEPASDDPSLERFVLPIPGKPPAIFQVPKNLSADDWTMLSVMLDTYILRMQNKQIVRSDKQSPSREGGALD